MFYSKYKSISSVISASFVYAKEIENLSNMEVIEKIKMASNPDEINILRGVAVIRRDSSIHSAWISKYDEIMKCSSCGSVVKISWSGNA